MWCFLSVIAVCMMANVKEFDLLWEFVVTDHLIRVTLFCYYKCNIKRHGLYLMSNLVLVYVQISP